MNPFEAQNRIAAKFLKYLGIIAVIKTTRTGATMSLTKACVEHKLKVVVFTHSIELIKEIERRIPKILGYKPKILVIPDNVKLCRRLNPTLKLKFQLRKDCRNCRYKGKPQHCVYQRLLTEEADIYLTTYHKLETMQRTDSRLLKVVYGCKVAILDEVGTRLLRSPPMIVVVEEGDGRLTKTSDLLYKQFRGEIEKYEEILATCLYDNNRKDEHVAHFWLTMETTVYHIENITEQGKHANRIDEIVKPRDDFMHACNYYETYSSAHSNSNILEEREKNRYVAEEVMSR